MNKKLVACILTFIIGTTVTANASAFACNIFGPSAKQICLGGCDLLSDKGFLGFLKKVCV
ncbi:hypothetical protein ID853_13355 [Xenorhabdus sp. Vera]|nr:hypothetical protein [Xenorhabdus sp. Vera]